MGILASDPRRSRSRNRNRFHPAVTGGINDGPRPTQGPRSGVTANVARLREDVKWTGGKAKPYLGKDWVVDFSECFVLRTLGA